MVVWSISLEVKNCEKGQSAESYWRENVKRFFSAQTKKLGNFWSVLSTKILPEGIEIYKDQNAFHWNSLLNICPRRTEQIHWKSRSKLSATVHLVLSKVECFEAKR